jgi:hypothetical protein
VFREPRRGRRKMALVADDHYSSQFRIPMPPERLLRLPVRSFDASGRKPS